MILCTTGAVGVLRRAIWRDGPAADDGPVPGPPTGPVRRWLPVRDNVAITCGGVSTSVTARGVGDAAATVRVSARRVLTCSRHGVAEWKSKT